MPATRTSKDAVSRPTRRKFLKLLGGAVSLGAVSVGLKLPVTAYARARTPELRVRKSSATGHNRKPSTAASAKAIIIRALIYQGAALPPAFPIAITAEGVRYHNKFLTPINSAYGKTAIGEVSPQQPIVYKGNAYAGTIIVVRKADKVFVVNELDLDSYLMGVVKREISSSWHLSAIKAQAVAARSYAFNYIDLDARALYHISSTTNHQVFGGTADVPPSIAKGVHATSDIILIDKFDKKPVQSFFHGCCGGVTEKAENVWGSETPLRYFKNIRCPYCTTHPLYRWERDFSEQHIHDALEQKTIRNVRTLRVARRTGSKRVASLVVNAAGGRYMLTGNQFRIAVSPKKIPSTLFHLRHRSTNYTLAGKGFGHGVGLCQWGAKTMAEKGFSPLAILDFYYKNCQPFTISKYVKKYRGRV